MNQLEKLEQALALEKAGRKQDMRERGLPHAWENKKTGKRYGLTGTHVMFGKVMVWLYEDGTTKALHLPLESLKNYYPLNADLKRFD